MKPDKTINADNEPGQRIYVRDHRSQDTGSAVDMPVHALKPKSQCKSMYRKRTNPSGAAQKERCKMQQRSPTSVENLIQTAMAPNLIVTPKTVTKYELY